MVGIKGWTWGTRKSRRKTVKIAQPQGCLEERRSVILEKQRKGINRKVMFNYRP